MSDPTMLDGTFHIKMKRIADTGVAPHWPNQVKQGSFAVDHSQCIIPDCIHVNIWRLKHAGEASMEGECAGTHVVMAA